MALTEVSMQKFSLNTKEHGYPDRTKIWAVQVDRSVSDETGRDQIKAIRELGPDQIRTGGPGTHAKESMDSLLLQNITMSVDKQSSQQKMVQIHNGSK